VGGWRRLHNEELHNLYTSPSIIRVIKSRRMRNVYNILVEKHEGKRPLGRPRRRWKDDNDNNNGMDYRETEWDDMDSMHMA
jgi:hypothetical protein